MTWEHTLQELRAICHLVCTHTCCYQCAGCSIGSTRLKNQGLVDRRALVSAGDFGRAEKGHANAPHDGHVYDHPHLQVAARGLLMPHCHVSPGISLDHRDNGTAILGSIIE